MKKISSNASWEAIYFNYNKLNELSDGDSATLALIDSGISEFQKNSVKKIKSYVSNKYDYNGHGTMMCSILLGFGDYLYGIAPKTNVYSYNIVDKNGKTDPDIMAKAIIDAVNDNVDLINISLGSYFDNRQVRDAVNYAYNNEVIVVASAGDYGSTQLLYPARYEQCISVGAKDSCELIWPDTDGSEKCDIIAPGVDITAIDENRNKILSTGTSQAAILVSGYVLLLKDYAKTNGISLNVSDVKRILHRVNNKEISFIDGFSEIKKCDRK